MTVVYNIIFQILSFNTKVFLAGYVAKSSLKCLNDFPFLFDLFPLHLTFIQPLVMFYLQYTNIVMIGTINVLRPLILRLTIKLYFENTIVKDEYRLRFVFSLISFRGFYVLSQSSMTWGRVAYTKIGLTSVLSTFPSARLY